MSVACMCVLVMDFEFALRVAEQRIKAALGKSDAGKMWFCFLLFLGFFYFIMDIVYTERQKDIRILAHTSFTYLVYLLRLCPLLKLYTM